MSSWRYGRIVKKKEFKEEFRKSFVRSREKIWSRKKEYRKTSGHRAFRKSHREDYKRDFNVPGLLQHSVDTFRELWKRKKVFLPLLLLMVILTIFLVGLLSEETYTGFKTAFDQTSLETGDNLNNFAKGCLLLISSITTGGINQSMSEGQVILLGLIFLVIWMVVIFLLRHFLAGNKPSLRDGLYNSCTPLVSTFLVFLVILAEVIPLAIVAITYASAIETGFLGTPFYALIYFLFAAAMILLSGYLLSGTIIAMIMVTAPGVYPLEAIRMANDLVVGRRLRIVLRFVFLIFALVILWIVVLLPIILLDMLIKSFGWLTGVPIVSFFMVMMLCFSMIYISAYLYLFYRRILDAN